MRDIGKETQFHIRHLLLDGYLMLQTINSEQDIHRRYNNHDEEKHIQEISKRSFPEGR